MTECRTNGRAATLGHLYGVFCSGRGGLAACRYAVLAGILALGFSSGTVRAANPRAVVGAGSENCGSVAFRPGQTGPWDYLNSQWRTPEVVELVESFHFTPVVEALVSGQSGYLGGDISYTLVVWPNHHRALMSMVNLSIREKTTKPQGARYSLNCYFDRAKRINPNDGMVDLIHAIYESRLGNSQNALTYAKKAEELLPQSKDVHYNLGLIYFNLKDYANAREHAKRAYALGHELPGLKQKLQAARAWDE